MISFEDAYRVVLSHPGEFGVEPIPLKKAIGRVLREDWYADRDMPPYDRVTMDGIAIDFDAAIDGNQLPKIEGLAAAGDPKMTLKNETACLEVMTGSILPENTDTIIRYEDVTIEDGVARINESYRKGQNIHYKGEDRKQGDALVSSGTKLSPGEIGVGASIGKHQIIVSQLPKTIVISTGDELVDIDETPLEHQIRKSNVYRIAATLAKAGVEVDTAHLLDDYDEIINRLTQMVQTYDLIVLSGGVSMGKFDFIPLALEKLAVKKHFHRVRQRPGKPFWFGTHPAGCTVFAMPGNPVSSFMCTHVYLLDWLDRSLGLEPTRRPSAILLNDVSFPKPLTYFLEVKISFGENGQMVAQPQKGHGSGDLANLLKGDAFIKLPTDSTIFKKGESYPVFVYK